jgi:hypothetical protein
MLGINFQNLANSISINELLTFQNLARLLIFLLIVFFIWWFIIKPQKKIPKILGTTNLLSNYKVDTSLVEGSLDLFKPAILSGLILPQTQSPKKRTYDKTEKMCRKILERHFNAEFPSARPEFLKSPVTKKNLELDCYNPDLKIALEYNGKQHYTYTPHFHRSKKDFYSQVHRDDWKRNKCKELGIKLIEVPYWISQNELEDWILSKV